MKVRVVVATVVALAAFAPHVGGRDGIDSRVLQVRMPNEDVELAYVENKQCFTVELSAKSARVEGVDLYVGDGKVAVPLRADSSQGIFFQGTIMLPTGHVFKKGSTVKLLPGFKRAVDLSPGAVYVTLPGVTFQLPAK